ncbi:hypothetical protein AB1Y20_004567 [Prymnesium parvum]|uniref:Protein transport protein SEC23 n=1 Tax=Prymnesium parvum TaxID=97485 RepID=A0AB34IX32_PRYPA
MLRPVLLLVVFISDGASVPPSTCGAGSSMDTASANCFNGATQTVTNIAGAEFMFSAVYPDTFSPLPEFDRDLYVTFFDVDSDTFAPAGTRVYEYVSVPDATETFIHPDALTSLRTATFAGNNALVSSAFNPSTGNVNTDFTSNPRNTIPDVSKPAVVAFRLGNFKENVPAPSVFKVYPPAPPRSPAPPSSPAGAAGNDPIFVGADGIPYRVDGQAGRAFNLVSSPCHSVNSEVQEVPAQFQYPRLGLTSTVFGSMHVSVGCRNTTERIGSGLWSDNSQLARFDVRFDVLSGTIRCRKPSKGHQEESCDTVPGLQVAEYYRECNLEDMTCDWFPVSARWSRMLSLAHVQPGITQTHLHIGNSVLIFTRDSLRQGNKLSCDDFRRWPTAHEACHLVAQHLSAAVGPQNVASLSEETIQRYLAILAAYRGMLFPAHTVFFFLHLAVKRLDARDFSNPALLHGLLGQRLLSPKPVPNRSIVIHPDDILQSAGAVNIQVSHLSSQGEGFIEGTYHDYMVPSLDNHCAFAFSRFLGGEC